MSIKASQQLKQLLKFNGYYFWHPYSGGKGGIVYGLILFGIIILLGEFA